MSEQRGVTALDARQARSLLRALKASLRRIVERDPEQEVQGIALPVVDEVLRVAQEVLPDHPVIARAEDVVSPEMIASGDPIRAVDALVVVDMLFEVLKDAAR